MRRVHFTLLGLGTVGFLSIALIGCGGGATTSPTSSGDKPTEPKTTVEWKAIEPGKGVLKGKATAKGGRPDAIITKADAELLAAINAKADAKDFCLTGVHNGKVDKPITPEEKEQQGFRVDKSGDVANVVVWIVPADSKNTYFKIDTSKKTWPDSVTVDQPHCAFIPHVSVAFTEYRDVDSKGKAAMKPTGQKVFVTNSSPVGHNTQWGDNGRNPGANPNLEPGKPPLELEKVVPSPDPIKLACKIHGWMDGYIWSLDTPYSAVTKEDGAYEIKGLPTGKFKVIAWHEKAGFLTNPKGDDIEIKDDTTKDFAIDFASK